MKAVFDIVAELREKAERTKRLVSVGVKAVHPVLYLDDVASRLSIEAGKAQEELDNLRSALAHIHYQLQSVSIALLYNERCQPREQVRKYVAGIISKMEQDGLVPKQQ